ncbi:MAG: hypothetical protein HGA87_06870 [Desulfobulbaceae bacterium]|nr:hypothetical protein [Desulfobulbaceae bacterium]
MIDTTRLRSATPGVRPDNTDATYCNRCGCLLRYYEYAILDECTHCGHSLIRNYYWVCLSGAALVIILCGLPLLIKQTPETVGSAILVTVFSWGWALGAIALDMLLLRLTPIDKALRRSLGGWISFLMAFGLFCLAYRPVCAHFEMPSLSLSETIVANPLIRNLPGWLLFSLNISGVIAIWYAIALAVLNSRVGAGSILLRAGRTIRVILNTRKCITITGAMALLLIGALNPFLGEFALEFPGLFLVGIGASILIQSLLPASVLFLSASKDEGRTLLRSLTRASYPLRFAHLLNIAGTGIPELRAPQVRVFSNWRGAVDAFSDAVPIMVVDLRVITGHVLEEVRHIFDRHLLVKTVFVVEEKFPDHSLLVLYQYAAEGDHALVGTPDMIEDAMRDLIFEVLRGQVTKPFQTLTKSLRSVKIG